MTAATWKHLPFEQVVDSRGAGTAGLPRTQWKPSGRFPVIGQGAEEVEGWTDREDLLLVPKPAVVLYGGHTRRAKHVTRPFVPGPNVKLLFPRPLLESGFLYYFLCHLPIRSKGYADHFPLVRKSVVPVPHVAEQKRLVGILDQAFDGLGTARANTEKNIENARALFESKLESVFANAADPNRTTLQTLLDRGWIESHMDGNHGSDYPRKEEFVDEGVPYISANCIDDGRVDMSRAKHLSPSRAALLRKGVARDQDVLFAHNATVGPVAILDTEEEKVILGTSLTYYRCNPAFILPEYLALYMRSFGFTAQYLMVMRQSTRSACSLPSACDRPCRNAG